MLLIKIFLLVVFTLQTHSERDPNWARGGPWGPPAPGNMYWDSKNTIGNDRGGGGGVGGGLIGVVDGPGGGGGGWDGQGQGGQPGCSRCTVLHDAGGPPLSDGGFGGNPGGGPPGSGGGPSSIPQYPPGYRGNGYDNFSPEWKLREVLQQQGSGAAPLGQVAAGGWKKGQSGDVGGGGGGSWSGTIRPIEPNFRRPNSFPWPPSSSPSGPWGPDTIPSGWGSRGPGPRKLDEPFRVSSGVIGGGGGGPPGGGAGGAGGNWVAGASGYKGGPMGGPGGGGGGGGYQGGGHGGYDEYGGNKVQGQSLNVHSGFRPWAQQPGFSGWNDGRGGGEGGGGSGGPGYGGGCQPIPPTEPPPMRGGAGGQPVGGCGPPGVPGMEGWGSGAGYATNWDHGRPVEPRPMEPYAPREPNINNPSNTDQRWMTRGPSWGFRDPPFGAESREPGFNPSNQNWNKVSGPSLTVSSGYPEPPARPPQKDQSLGYGSSGSPWPSRGPPPQKYPASFGQKDQSFGGSARRPGFGCRDLGCGGAPAQQPWGPTQGSGGGWAASGPAAPSSNRQPPYWGDKQPPPGAPSGYKPGYGGQGGYPSQDQGGYMQQGYASQGQGYPGQGYPAQGPPPAYPPQGQGAFPPQGGYPSGGGYDTPPNGASGYQSGPGASGYQQAGGGPGGGPGASGYQSGPGASGYQSGPGASGYQGGAGASGYQSGPGASGYPPSSEYEGPPRKYNGHSGVGATLDFPGLQAYAHDTSNHGSYSHCSNKTSSNDQHGASSTASPTSTNAP